MNSDNDDHPSDAKPKRPSADDDANRAEDRVSDSANDQPIVESLELEEPDPLPPPQRPERNDTAASRAERPSPAERRSVDAASLRPLVRSHRPEVPLIVAGCAAAIYVAGCLAGQSGLFPVFSSGAIEGEVQRVSPDWASRMLLLLRGFVMILLGGGCLVAGAYIFHLLERRPLGDLRVLASRMLAIAALALLVRMVPIDIAWAKKFYDALAPLALAFLMLMLFFRLPPRDAGVVLGGAMITLTIVAFGSVIVAFAL